MHLSEIVRRKNQRTSNLANECGGHPILAHKERTCQGNTSLTNASDGRVVWAVTPYCFNHEFSTPLNILPSFGRRKSLNMPQ